MFNGRVLRVAVVLLIAIICGVVFFANKNGILRTPMLLGSIGRSRIGEGAELGSDAFSSGSDDTAGQAVDMSKWDMDRVNAVADTDGVYVPVPKGFVASGATGEHTVNTGFVIYEGEEPVNDENAWDESCRRNQFVWVPVPDPSRVFEEIGTTGKKKAKLWEYNATGRIAITNDDTDTRREPGILNYSNTYNPNWSRDIKKSFAEYEMQGFTRERLNKELAISFDNDMESIKRYGGFYIGRYETGNLSSEYPVVQRMNKGINYQTWYAMYIRMRNISTNENVETNMIWGCLWDETLQWFIDTNIKTLEEIGSNSVEWGNYPNATFTYTYTSGITATKPTNSKTIIPTGSTERNKANNIYDMAGNISDLTLEGTSTDGRYRRGGNYQVENGNMVCSRGGSEIQLKSNSLRMPFTYVCQINSHLLPQPNILPKKPTNVVISNYPRPNSFVIYIENIFYIHICGDYGFRYFFILV